MILFKRTHHLITVFLQLSRSLNKMIVTLLKFMKSMVSTCLQGD